MLTKKQRDLLLLINDHVSKGQIAPSFDEMKDAIGLKSKSGIHRLIGALEERGFIRRLPNRARAIEILKLPHGYQGQQQLKVSQTSKTSLPSNNNIVDVPLCGKIAAGTPIEAISHEGHTISLPDSMIGHGDHYALTIDGDSMIDAGINDGDTVLIQKCDTARDGDIIVALVDNQEATLKRLRRRGGHVDLIPENRDHDIRTYEANRVEVQGKLAGLYRTYH
jgi:repressor LexA